MEESGKPECGKHECGMSEYGMSKRVMGLELGLNWVLNWSGQPPSSS
jgi:hypothetical protein